MASLKNIKDWAGHADGRELTYPNGRTINYNYSTGLDSAASRITSISDTSGTIQSYQYQGLDTPMVATSGNGVVGTTVLDSLGRISSLTYTNSSGGVIDGFSYAYDADGNVLSKTNLALSTDSETYGYDNLNRLISFTRGTTTSESWNYNALGDWNSETVNGVTTSRSNSAQNQATQIGSSTGLIGSLTRWLNPATGQWNTQDPTGAMYVNGLDLDQADLSNPVGNLDPSGLQTEPGEPEPVPEGGGAGEPPFSATFPTGNMEAQGLIQKEEPGYNPYLHLDEQQMDELSGESAFLQNGGTAAEWQQMQEAQAQAQAAQEQAAAGAEREAVDSEAAKLDAEIDKSLTPEQKDKIAKAKAAKSACPNAAERTPAENRAARNQFKNNKDAARNAWEQRQRRGRHDGSRFAWENLKSDLHQQFRRRDRRVQLHV